MAKIDANGGANLCKWCTRCRYGMVVQMVVQMVQFGAMLHMVQIINWLGIGHRLANNKTWLTRYVSLDRIPSALRSQDTCEKLRYHFRRICRVYMSSSSDQPLSRMTLRNTYSQRLRVLQAEAQKLSCSAQRSYSWKKWDQISEIWCDDVCLY